LRPIGGNRSVGEHELSALARTQLLLDGIQNDVRGLRHSSQLPDFSRKLQAISKESSSALTSIMFGNSAA
jgi:hypothetical protein